LGEPKDYITVFELFAQKETYADRTDGAASNGKFDLTITSLSKVKTGDVVTFEGKVSLNKDFGYGYVFEVMLEDATLK